MNGDGEPIRARMAPRRERTPLAAWKMVVPVIVVFFLLHCRMWYAEEEWLWRVLLADIGYQDITGNCTLVLGAIGLGDGCSMPDGADRLPRVTGCGNGCW